MGFINKRWFQHDYDPTHAATATEKWFVDKDTDVLTWPSNTENVWWILKEKIQATRPANLK